MDTTRPVRVLIIGSDPSTAGSIQNTLEHLGYMPIGSLPGGAQAVEQACSLRPDVILIQETNDAAWIGEFDWPAPIVLIGQECPQSLAPAMAWLDVSAAARDLDRAIAVTRARWQDRRELHRQDVGLRSISAELRHAQAELDVQKRWFENLVMVARATSQNLALDVTLQNALDVAVTITGAEHGSLFLLDDAGMVTQSVLARGPVGETQRRTILDQVMSQGVGGWVVRRRQALLIYDTANDPRWISLPNDPYATRSALCVPIIFGDVVMGVLTLTHAEAAHFGAEHLALIQAAADQMALSLRNAQLYAEMRRYAGDMEALYNSTRRLNASLADERQRLSTLIDSSRDGIFFFGMDGRVQVANSAALELLRLPGQSDDWPGQTIEYTLSALERHAPMAARALRTAADRISDGTEPPGEGDIEIPPRFLRWLDMPVLTEDDVLGRLLVLRDVTEQRQLERMRDDLTRMMVHDLRNPLTGISVSLELLQTQLQDQLGEALQSVLEAGQTTTRRMLTLVNAILDLSRLESGKMPLQPTAVSVQELVEAALRGQALLAAQKHLYLEQDIAPDLPPARVDRTLVERVLDNLLGNAIKFVHEGGIIRISVRRTAGAASWLHLSVYNNGPHIPAELRDQLFQKFVTGQQEGRGSGLGLAFCKLAVEAHGGRIWVDSEPEQGVDFSFTLPAASS